MKMQKFPYHFVCFRHVPISISIGHPTVGGSNTLLCCCVKDASSLSCLNSFSVDHITVNRIMTLQIARFGLGSFVPRKWHNLHYAFMKETMKTCRRPIVLCAPEMAGHNHKNVHFLHDIWSKHKMCLKNTKCHSGWNKLRR